ncbi:MAG: RDD family protein [Acidobacteria bacterium]|nr:RDD family protein [Acidobacteriota bacterium]
MTHEEKVLTAPWWNCPACGYRNAENEYRCEKCGRRLQTLQAQAEPKQSRPAGHAGLFPSPSATPEYSLSGTARTRRTTAENRSREPFLRASGHAPSLENLREHLSGRVQDYRHRRLNPTLPLQFEEDHVPENKVIPIGTISSRPARAPRRPAAGRRPKRPRPVPPGQPALNFPAPALKRASYLAPAVAPFRLRMLGHGIDFAWSLAALLVFLVTLKLMAGPLVSDQFLLISGICAYLFVTLLYGALFLGLTGATPGMHRLGLRLVNFDGIPAPRRQLFWRLLGAVASAGSFFLGYLWAAVDEEHLSWHDRISKTFLTTAPLS